MTDPIEWTKVEDNQDAEPLQECLSAKLPTTTHALICYLGQDGEQHVHTHVVGGGREAAMAFLTFLRDQYIPVALRTLGH